MIIKRQQIVKFNPKENNKIIIVHCSIVRNKISEDMCDLRQTVGVKCSRVIVRIFNLCHAPYNSCTLLPQIVHENIKIGVGPNIIVAMRYREDVSRIGKVSIMNNFLLC